MEQINESRRWFIKALAGSGIAIAISPHLPSFASGAADKTEWCVYVTINKDNSVVMSSPVMDMGQHMKTTGPMILADELDLDWSLIEFTKDCPAWLTKNAEGEIGYRYSDMGTGGSHAVRRNWHYLREAGATVRRMLLQEAAQRWQVPVKRLQTERSFVIDPTSGKRFSYGSLAEAAANQQVVKENLSFKEKSEYQIMGKDTRTIDIQDIVTGKPTYGIDMDYPGVIQAVIHRAPQTGAEIASYNKQAALDIPGVKAVVEMPRIAEEYWNKDEKQIVASGIAVLADNLWSAMQGKKALQTQWTQSPHYQDQDSEQQLAQFNSLVQSDKTAKERKKVGDAAGWLANHEHLDHTYETPLFAHVCMEPFNCIADIGESHATVVVGHQFPDIVADEVEKLTDIDALKVKVVSKRMGGGFGRRYERDFVREAVYLSKTLKQPVKVTWTREDEIERDYFAPAFVMRVRAGNDANGKLAAWHHRQAQTRGGARDECFPNHLIPHFYSENFADLSKIPTGPWRGPAHLQWTFAAESMTDELAHQAKKDPLEYRLAMMKPHKVHPYDGFGSETIDSGRMAICYKEAANLADWNRKRPKGHGLGIAGHFTFGSYAAFVVEVKVENQQLKIIEAWGAIDCGFAINPNHIRNQMEGGFIDGLNAALFNKVNIKKGTVTNNNFDTLRFMRLADSPENISVTIVKNSHEPSGVGEPPTAPAAAALTNAIFAASGQRIRSLPIAEHLSV